MRFSKFQNNFVAIMTIVILVIAAILIVVGYVQMLNAREALHQALGVYGAAVARMLGKNTTGMVAIWYDGGEIVEAAFNVQSGILLGIGIGFACAIPFIFLWLRQLKSKQTREET